MTCVAQKLSFALSECKTAKLLTVRAKHDLLEEPMINPEAFVG
jgi:hypothetical protein